MNPAPPHVERLHGGRPVIGKNSRHDWENRVTFNPACVLLADQAEVRNAAQALPVSDEIRALLLRQEAVVVLLYRAQGMKTASYDHTRSSLGLALLSPELDLLARLDRPVVLPEEPYEDLGVEDPRITRVGDRYWMCYAGYASGAQKNRIRICLASSKDLVHWTKHGPLKGSFNGIDNKNGMLFAEGKLMLHRPMEGEGAMMVHWAESDDVLGEWRTRGVLMRWIANPAFKDVWVGGGAPPILLPDGRYLVLYHVGNRDVHGKREYDLGLALLDLKASEPVVKRTEPLLRPSTIAETTGDPELGVNNVVFVCGAYFWEGDLYFPYAGADSCILAGRIRKKEIEKFLG